MTMLTVLCIGMCILYTYSIMMVTVIEFLTICRHRPRHTKHMLFLPSLSHTHTLSLSLTHTETDTHTLSLSLSLSLSHTHTHTLSHTHTHSLFLPISHTHAHKQYHMYVYLFHCVFSLTLDNLMLVTQSL